MSLRPGALIAPLCAAWSLSALAAPPDGAPPPSDGPPSSEPAEQPPPGASAPAPLAPEDSASPPDSAPPDSAPPPSPAPTTIPPRFLRGARPTLPPGEFAAAYVEFFVVIGVDGRVSETEVALAPSPELIPTAVAAARSWEFAPARRGDTLLPARTRLRVDFDPPPLLGPETSTPTAPAQAPAAASPRPAAEDHNHRGPHEGDTHLEVTVHGNRAPRAEVRGPSDYFIHHEVLAAAPRQEGADVLRSVPGLLAVRTEGLAVAHSLSLRGFDAEHGQDIAISVGGIPINQPSHVHGQGYADVGFLMADAVDHLLVKEGVADPRQGDFSVAGSIDVDLGVDESRRGLFLETGFGSFDTYRQKVLWAPREADRESFGAVQLTTTGGFGENRSGQAMSGLLQHRFGRGEISYRAIAIGHLADAKSAGMVRRDDVQNGVVCFTCVYDSETARAQGASSGRLLGGFFADYTGPEHASGSLGLWGGVDDFRALSNATGYTQVSERLPGVSGRGDLFEQTNRAGSLGIVGRYRTQALEVSPAIHGTLEAGLDGRLDLIDQSQSLVDASVHNQVWDERVRADLRLLQLGSFLDLDVQVGRALTLRGGARATLQNFLVHDHLGNLPDPSRPSGDSLPGYRRSASGSAVLPRASVEVRATPELSFSASYGQGYRSVQAALLEDGQSAPFALLDSADLGVRYRLGDRLDAKLTGHATFLSDEVTLDAVDQRLESVGPSTRVGGTLHVQLRPWKWFVGSLSTTLVRATLDEPPPPTAQEPFPPFVAGQAVPGVPALTARLDLSVQRPLGKIASEPLELIVRTGATVASERPLGYSQTTPEVAWLDASLGLRHRQVELTVSGYNLGGDSMAAREAVFVSNWAPEEVPSRVPQRHAVASSPPAFFVTLGGTL